MLKYILYGDGIHDDTDAIQEMIDSGVCEVSLPAPNKLYLISRPLVIPSNFKLKLPRYAEIKLADGSDCFMLQNRTVNKPQARLREFLAFTHKALWRFYDSFSPDKEDVCHDFEIEGGIWNFNNMNQTPNPIYTRKFDDNGYLGHVMFFYNVRNFRISNLTIKDPANYAVMVDTGSYFTIENIVFDFNFGNPIAGNMDGIHLNGNCHYGIIKNLQGACYDDLVALNAHEGSGGDITNIEIDGLFAENCHSAVRLLTVNHNIEHISISNVYGSYYQYCIGFTKYYPGETTGRFDAISLDNIHASKSARLPIQEAHMGNKNYHFPFIWIQSGTVIGKLSIDHVHRRERVNPVDTIHIEKTAVVECLHISDLTLENYTDKFCEKLVNYGCVKSIYTVGMSKNDISNYGVIEQIYGG
ncbi:MAG: hypothetical protein E7588_06925 [Ruminococcaceae bacterium]|nr:hypothetical protein [Oscillospiraceae bacterium]